ncbi:ABC transporter permease [Candidatus Protochlamydia sp. W-9]|uniref:ABC transporter permease n=1 Tax=Candidatus Protochlamydia sp. W-9 TaxID=1785087 RepID=UPI00096AC333|nr:ABC transporter permease [Candidatus Protochlamydia sp. W-9]
MYQVYFCRKFIYLLSSLWIIITLTFILMKAVPGDPFNDEQGLRTDIHQTLIKKHGLDQSGINQYLNYLSLLLKGNLGYSLKYQGRSTNQIIQESFPISAQLGFQAIFIALIGGVILGLIGALKKNKWQDFFILILTAIGTSIPSFILATFLQYIFAIKWGVLPLAQWGNFNQSILPSLSLALLPMAFIARLTRASLIEILKTDYIKAAQAKGLPYYKILYSHALRNALLPVISYLGQLLANILVGSFIIEKIFSIPGLGGWFVNSVLSRDYPVIMGLTLFYSTLLLLSVFIVDIIYSLLDPRIQLIHKELV